MATEDIDVLLGSGDSNNEVDLLVDAGELTKVDWRDRVGVVVMLPATAVANSCKIVGVVTLVVECTEQDGCGSIIIGDMATLHESCLDEGGTIDSVTAALFHVPTGGCPPPPISPPATEVAMLYEGTAVGRPVAACDLL